MAFAQLTWRESLRDIELTLGAKASKLYAMGLRHSIHHSTLGDAYESRDSRIWSDVAALLMRRARKLTVYRLGQRTLFTRWTRPRLICV